LFCPTLHYSPKAECALPMQAQISSQQIHTITLTFSSLERAKR
jgi:hypothetical protein